MHLTDLIGQLQAVQAACADDPRVALQIGGRQFPAVGVGGVVYADNRVMPDGEPAAGTVVIVGEVTER